jgi:hypothetical protein
MKGSTVLRLPLQLVFPALNFVYRGGYLKSDLSKHYKISNNGFSFKVKHKKLCQLCVATPL